MAQESARPLPEPEEPSALAVSSPGVYLSLGKRDVLWGIRDPSFLGTVTVENFALRYVRKELPSEILGNPRLLAGRPCELGELSLRLTDAQATELLRRALRLEEISVGKLQVYLRNGRALLAAEWADANPPAYVTAECTLGPGKPPQITMRLVEARLYGRYRHHPAVLWRQLLARLGASFVHMASLTEVQLDVLSLPVGLLAARCGAAHVPKVRDAPEVHVEDGALTVHVEPPSDVVVAMAGPSPAAAIPAEPVERGPLTDVEEMIASERYADGLTILRGRTELLDASPEAAMRLAELALLADSKHAINTAIAVLERHRGGPSIGALAAGMDHLLAAMHVSLGNPAEAMNRLSPLLESARTNLDPLHLDPLAAWCAELWAGDLKQTGRALETLEMVLRARPASPRCLGLWQKIASASRAPSEISLFTEELIALLQEDPACPPDTLASLHRVAGRSVIAAGGSQELALRHLTEATKINPRDFEAWESIAEAQVTSGRFREAAETYRLTGASRPPHESGEAAEDFVRAGRLYDEKLSDHKTAEACYEQAASRAGGPTEAWLALAAVRRSRNAKAGLLEAYEKLIEQGVTTDPEGRFLPYEAGRVAEEIGDLPKAASHYARACGDAPEDTLHWEAYVSVLERLREFEQADAACEAWLQEINPDQDAVAYATVLLRLATMRFYSRKMPTEALAAAERARRLDRVSVEAWWLCGESLLALKRPPEAASAFERAAELAERYGEDEKAMALRERLHHLYENEVPDPEGAREQTERLTILMNMNPSAVESYRVEYESQGRWDRLAALHACLARHAQRAGDTARQADQLVRAGSLYAGPLADPTEAGILFERALKVSPDHVGALRGLCQVTLAAGDWERSESVLFRLLRTPDVTEAERRGWQIQYADALRARSETGLDRLAQGAYQQVLQTNPNDTEALSGAIEIAERQGRWEDVLVFGRRLLAALPADQTVALRRKLAGIHEQKFGDAAAALEQVDALAKAKPDDLDVQLERARLLETTGDPSGAVQACERALTLMQIQHAGPERRCDAHLTAARLLFQQLGRVDAAFHHLEEAVALAPQRREPRVARLGVQAARKDLTAVASDLRSLLGGTAAEPASYDSLAKVVQLSTAEPILLEWADRLQAVAAALRGEAASEDSARPPRKPEAASLTEARRPGPAAGPLLTVAESVLPLIPWYFESHFAAMAKIKKQALLDPQHVTWSRALPGLLGLGALRWFTTTEGRPGSPSDFADRAHVLLDARVFGGMAPGEQLFVMVREAEKTRVLGHYLAAMSVPELRRLLILLSNLYYPMTPADANAKEWQKEVKKLSDSVPAATASKVRDAILMLAGSRDVDEGLGFALREMEEMADRVAVAVTQDPVSAFRAVLALDGYTPTDAGTRSVLTLAPPTIARRASSLLLFAFSPAGLAPAA